MKKQVADLRTGKVKKREFTAAEMEQWRKDQQEEKSRLAEASAVAQAADSAIAKLLALGLTAAEIQALSGRTHSGNPEPAPQQSRSRSESPTDNDVPDIPSEPPPQGVDTAPFEAAPDDPIETEE